MEKESKTENMGGRCKRKECSYYLFNYSIPIKRRELKLVSSSSSSSVMLNKRRFRGKNSEDEMDLGRRRHDGPRFVRPTIKKRTPEASPLGGAAHPSLDGRGVQKINSN